MGIVVQRYGRDVLGGAETLSREVAERLHANGFDVTVFTTTARDYISWRNEFPPGDSVLKGVMIKRFPVAEERDIEGFNRYSEEFFRKESHDRDENRWIRLQGPHVPALIDAMEREQDDYDIFLFFTYLYYTTVKGMGVIRKPIGLFPTAHDELPVYMEVMKEVFRKPDALFFLTGAEREFVQKTFSPPNRQFLVRTGMDIVSGVDGHLFRRSKHIYAPYMLYAGRIEKGKGLEAAFKAFEGVRKKELLDFILIGKKMMDIPSIEGLKYMGYVSEEEKLSAFRGAAFSLQPSQLESLSITTLESFSQCTPVIVNRNSAVLNEHVSISKGGVSYGTEVELEEQMIRLLKNKKERILMGKRGYEYVAGHFSWDTVVAGIKEGIASVLG